MQLRCFRETNDGAAMQNISSILLYLKVLYHVLKNPTLVPTWTIQAISPHSISLRSILVLSTHLFHWLPNGLFPPGFPSNNLHAFLFSVHATCLILSTHLLTLRHSNCTWQKVQVTKLLIMQPPVTSSFHGPNLLLSTLFSNTLSLFTSLNVWDKIHTHIEPQAKL
jgi:hypothetical protein